MFLRTVKTIFQYQIQAAERKRKEEEEERRRKKELAEQDRLLREAAERKKREAELREKMDREKSLLERLRPEEVSELYGHYLWTLQEKQLFVGSLTVIEFLFYLTFVLMHKCLVR